jgi:hypothetical protein
MVESLNKQLENLSLNSQIAKSGLKAEIIITNSGKEQL